MLRVGIAGLGFGAGVHLPVFQSIPGVEVTALLGRQPKRVRAMAEKFRVPGAYTSLDAFFNQLLDAVVIALPPESAAAAASAALERNLAILGEKPIAATAAEAAVLAARGQDSTTLVDFEFRELASFRALKVMLAKRTLGQILRIRIVWRSMSYAQKNQLWSWKTDNNAGGGVLTLNGLHLFDLLEWLFEAVEPVEARLTNTATQAFAPRGAHAADHTADILLRTHDGIDIDIHLCNAAEDDLGHRWEIQTASGHAEITDGGTGAFTGFTLSLVTPDAGHVTLARDPEIDGDFRIGPVTSLAKRFVAAVKAGACVEPDFTAAARAQSLLQSVHAIAANSLYRRPSFT